MGYPVGGRGKKASYDTKLVRVPEPLEHQVTELKARYYGFIDGGGDPYKPVNWIRDEESKQDDGGETNQLELINDLIRRWEDEMDKVNTKTNVRWDKAAKLLAELRQVIGED